MTLDSYNHWFWFSYYEREPGWPEYDLIVLGMIFALTWTENTNHRLLEVFPCGRRWTLTFEYRRKEKRRKEKR